MKDAGVDLVTTCMDQNGVLTIEREMEKQNLDAIQYLPNAYDHDFMEQYGEFFEGSYVRTRFAPFETKPLPKGLQLFNKWMDEDRARRRRSWRSIGWIDADMFVTGLRAAGPNFTQPEGDRRAEQAHRLRRPGHPPRPRLDDPAQGPDRSRRTARRRTARRSRRSWTRSSCPRSSSRASRSSASRPSRPTLPDQPTHKA